MTCRKQKPTTRMAPSRLHQRQRVPGAAPSPVQPRPISGPATSGVFSTQQALRQMLLERVGKEFDVAMFHGRMEVKGHHVKLIKAWLERLGF